MGDSRALAPREVMELTGTIEFLAQRIEGPRKDTRVVYPNRGSSANCPILFCQEYNDLSNVSA